MRLRQAEHPLPDRVSYLVRPLTARPQRRRQPIRRLRQLILPKEVADPTVVVFLVDGMPKAKDELAAPMRLSPGEHVLKMERKDDTTFESTFTAGPKNDETVEVPRPTEVAAAPPGPAPVGPNNTYRSGHLMLERSDRDTEVMFRVIEIKDLPPSK